MELMFRLKHKVDGFGLQYCTINLEGLALGVTLAQGTMRWEWQLLFQKWE
jgi:hypothetical protein